MLPTGRKEEGKRFGLASFLPVNPRLLEGSGGSRLPWEQGHRRLWASAAGFGLLILLREQLASATWPLLRLQKQQPERFKCNQEL